MRSEWKQVTIGEIADKIAMGPFGSNIKVETFVDSGVPIISGNHLRGTYLTEDSFNYITEEHANRLKNSLVYAGDIIFTHAGNVGQVAMIPYNCLHTKYIISQRQFFLRCNKNKACPEFVTYFFHSRTGQFKLLSNVNSTGVPSIAQPSTHLKSIEILLPSLPEQRAIAATLSCLDDKIELNNKMSANLEAQAQAIFKSWFVDFKPFQDGVFVDSELGPIPKGWRVETLGELGEIVGGATPSKEKAEYFTSSGNGIAWITPKDLSISKYKFFKHGELDITELGYKSSSTKLMPRGTILFSSRAPIGYMAIAKNEVCTNQGFKSIIPHKEIGSGFVYNTLKYRLAEIQNMGSGSTFKEVSGSVMRNIKALIPDKKATMKFQSVCDVFFKQQEILESQSRALASIRDALLPKLMSGEVEVPVEV